MIYGVRECKDRRLGFVVMLDVMRLLAFGRAGDETFRLHDVLKRTTSLRMLFVFGSGCFAQFFFVESYNSQLSATREAR
jgi:hypothetical protein